MKTVPLALAPPPLLKAASQRLRGITRLIIPFFPELELQLKQAGIKTSAEDYVGYVLTSLLTNTVIITIVFYLLFMKILQPSNANMWLMSTVGIVLFTLFMQSVYPKY